MPIPLYQSKAEFFRTLGHPARIRILELLADGPLAVKDLLAAMDIMDIEAASMSQQLAVLRRAGVVGKLPDGRYELACPEVPELLRAARGILAKILVSQNDLLDALRDELDVDAGDAAVPA